MSIPVGDLDLATEAGRNAFNKRVRTAAADACGSPAPFRAAEEAVVLRCRREFTASANAASASRFAARSGFAQAGMK